ncbi:MAG: hypothetical protein HW421_692 [Ignavibacteria bacterium]|nr:hypothetical protein [Ignavibacteria bacterium]
MGFFEINISDKSIDFFKSEFQNFFSFEEANSIIQIKTGIFNFFNNQAEFEEIKSKVLYSSDIINEPDRAEYGDFQTNTELAERTVNYLSTKGLLPDIIIEPTCGKGNFIMAALQNFQTIKKIIGIEIYMPYIWESKFAILDYFIITNKAATVEIELYGSNVFEYDFKRIADNNSEQEILIIGNPPWVTNSKLGSINSKNLPDKSNFKNHNGLDAMTGKGNFDIGESITLKMLKAFHNYKGAIAFLIKNSVIKNIIYDQKLHPLRISNIEKLSFESKKEFNASVEASMFFCRFNSQPDYICNEFDLYNNAITFNSFGWITNKFVANISKYEQAKVIDATCPFEWRQGVKHDCSSIMEFERLNEHFINGRNEEIFLENDLVYGLLKSSDLKSKYINKSRKHTIITQMKIGQDTRYLKEQFPLTYKYLSANQEHFIRRKSSIYIDKPAFSIFGIGDYSFKPYKVAISGLYKNYSFNLILPQDGKPLMLDDTCYFISFDRLKFAVYSYILLNSTLSTEFIKSITFTDAKRTFTKEILMRIDLFKLATLISHTSLNDELVKINEELSLSLTFDFWDEFLSSMQPVKSRQESFF